MRSPSRAPGASRRALGASGCVLALVGLGASPLLFLGSRPFVYEEAILWGVGFASLAMGAVISAWTRPRPGTLVLLVVADVLAMQARRVMERRRLAGLLAAGCRLLGGQGFTRLGLAVRKRDHCGR